MPPSGYGFLPGLEGSTHGRLGLASRLRQVTIEQHSIRTVAPADLSPPTPISTREGALGFDEIALSH